MQRKQRWGNRTPAGAWPGAYFFGVAVEVDAELAVDFFPCRLCFLTLLAVVLVLEFDVADEPLDWAISAAPVSIKPIIKVFIIYSFLRVLLAPSRIHHEPASEFLR